MRIFAKYLCCERINRCWTHHSGFSSHLWPCPPQEIHLFQCADQKPSCCRELPILHNWPKWEQGTCARWTLWFPLPVPQTSQVCVIFWQPVVICPTSMDFCLTYSLSGSLVRFQLFSTLLTLLVWWRELTQDRDLETHFSPTSVPVMASSTWLVSCHFSCLQLLCCNNWVEWTGVTRAS